MGRILRLKVGQGFRVSGPDASLEVTVRSIDGVLHRRSTMLEVADAAGSRYVPLTWDKGNIELVQDISLGIAQSTRGGRYVSIYCDAAPGYRIERR